MKRILIICFISCSLPALSQSKADSVKRVIQHQQDSLYRVKQVAEKKKLAMDSLATELEGALKIPKQKATQVLTILDQSIEQMTTQARDRTIPNDEKTARLKKIAAQRDQQIAFLLDEKQVQQLQEIMMKNRKKYSSNR